MTDKDDEAPDGQSGASDDQQRDIPGQEPSSSLEDLPPDPFGYAEDFGIIRDPAELTEAEDDYRRRAFEKAAHYAGHYGIPVFPVWWMATEYACACPEGINCSNKGKHPIDLGWPEMATNDPEQAARWWRPMAVGEKIVDWRPRANVGLAMGDKHFLLDVDMGEGKNGDLTLGALISHHGQDMPHTLMYQTGGGGRQHVMIIPDGTEARNSVSELGDNLDIRGKRGYGIAPPSVSGKGEYVSVIDAPPNYPPEWLADWLVERQRKRNERLLARPKGSRGRQLPAEMSPRARGYIHNALADAVKRVSEAPDGQRNNILNKESWGLFTRFGVIGLLDPGEIATALKSAAHACGLKGEEVPNTLSSAWAGAESKDRSGELPNFVFEEPSGASGRIPSIVGMVYHFEEEYDLRRGATGEFISRPATEELPPLVSDIGDELGWQLRWWWRTEAEAWNQHIAEIVKAAAADPDKKDEKVEGEEYCPVFPPEAAFSNAISHLRTSAAIRHKPVIQHTRCFDDPDENRIIIDLCNDMGDVVEVTPGGFKVMDPRHVQGQPWFRRGGDMGTQVYPEEPGGVYEALENARLVLGVEDQQWKVILAGLIGAFFPSIDRPGWWLTGPSGAGKTTRGRMIAGWVDPSKYLGGRLNIKRDERNARTRAMHRYIVTMDNYTTITQDENDFWCTLHTGVSEAVRKLHSDNVMLAYEYKRLGLATSLVLPEGLQGDALRRTLHVELPVSDTPPDSSRLWREYDNIKPSVVGALCLVLSGVLRKLDEAERANLPDCPEMGGFARRLHAADLAYSSLGLYDAYVGHTVAVQLIKASNDPFALALKHWLEEIAGGEFTGLISKLYSALGKFVGFDTSQRWWPSDATRLSGKLTKLRQPLAAAGIYVGEPKHTRDGSVISIQMQETYVTQDDVTL